jgi:hypothetical protein
MTAAVEPKELTVSLNSQTCWYLDRLIETGLYGNKQTDAVKVVLYDHCKLLVADGKIPMAPSIPGTTAVAVTGAAAERRSDES